MTYQLQQEIALREKVFAVITHLHDYHLDVRTTPATEVIEAIWDEWKDCPLTMNQLDYYLVEWESQNPLH
jgi:uncharacterized protein YqgV (UPF0045/DUF77 family)